VADERTRKANARLILDVIGARGGDGRVLHAIATRESGLNHEIRHELPADREGSVQSWKRNAERYKDNPYYQDSALWDHGKGLFAMMPANHLFRWDSTAHPDVLFNPYVATVVASRLARSCMERGAETWADVNQCWATGSPERTSSWPDRRDRLIARLEKLGYPGSLADAPPDPGNWGTGPQVDQVDALWALAGEPLPLRSQESSPLVVFTSNNPATITTTTRSGNQIWLPLLGFGAVGFGLWVSLRRS